MSNTLSKIMNNTMKSICFIVAMNSCFSVNANSLPFTEQAFTELKQQKLGTKWLIILWSIECPPCFKELELVNKLNKELDQVNVVLINTDDNRESRKLSKKIIADFQLVQLNNYFFVEDQAAQNRYLIDSSWYGELPRSYFIDSRGIFHGKSGLVDEQVIRKWLTDPQ